MNLLITGAWAEAAAYFARIEEMGHAVQFMQNESDQLPCEYGWVEGVVCNGLFLHHSICKFVNLRYIQLTSSGYDRVPMDDNIVRRGIEIHNARGVYSIPMAEFVIAGVLDLYKNMGRFREQQKNHSWEKNRGLRELYGSRVVIVGCGSVGSECAKRFRAFGCDVVGVDAFIQKNEAFHDIVSLERLDDVLPEADVVVLSLPLTERTRGLFDTRRLSVLNERCILVNVSRGAIVDREALEKWKGAAVLDVFEEEPLGEESPLWEKKDTIITPHNSYVGNGNGPRLGEVIIRRLAAVLDR